MAETDLPSGAQELFPVEVTDGILPVTASLQASIPFPPQAILTDRLNLPIEADRPHIPEVHGYPWKLSFIDHQ